jgi:hypothetical protein
MKLVNLTFFVLQSLQVTLMNNNMSLWHIPNDMILAFGP